MPGPASGQDGRSFDAGAEHEPVLTDRLIAIANHGHAQRNQVGPDVLPG